MTGLQADMMRSSREAARRLYRAAVQPDPLTNWGKILSDHLGSYSSLTLIGPAGKVIDIGSSASHDPERLDYIQRYQYINPLNRFWETAPLGQVIHFDQKLIDDECRGSEFYSRYSAYLGIQDGVCMLLSVGGAQKVLLNVLLPHHTRAAERLKALLADLSDDLKLALEIAGAFLEASNTVGSVIDGLDREGVGVAILSGDGRIKNANHRMTALLQDDRGLRAELQGAVVHPSAAAGFDRPGRGGRAFGRRRIYENADHFRQGRVAVYPAAQNGGDPEGSNERFVVFVTDGGDKRIDLTEHLRAEFGLTRAEARVAERLRDGRTSSQIAAEFGVQSNCVRSHLKSIFAKTATHSQVELLNFLQHENDLSLAVRPDDKRQFAEPIYS